MYMYAFIYLHVKGHYWPIVTCRTYPMHCNLLQSLPSAAQGHFAVLLSTVAFPLLH